MFQALLFLSLLDKEQKLIKSVALQLIVACCSTVLVCFGVMEQLLYGTHYCRLFNTQLDGKGALDALTSGILTSPSMLLAIIY